MHTDVRFIEKSKKRNNFVFSRNSFYIASGCLYLIGRIRLIRALASARGSVATRRAPRTKGTATRGPEGPESGQIMRVRGPEGPEDELS